MKQSDINDRELAEGVIKALYGWPHPSQPISEASDEKVIAEARRQFAHDEARANGSLRAENVYRP